MIYFTELVKNNPKMHVVSQIAIVEKINITGDITSLNVKAYCKGIIIQAV